MPTCPGCGQAFSGFSFGSEVADVCRNCRAARKKAAQTQLAATRSAAAIISSKGYVVTYTIIAFNVLVYLAMGISGVSWTNPNTLDAIKWGADFGPLTLSQEWWRLATSAFVHFGIIHVGFNMICFWDLGRGLEPLMGRRAFLLVYCVSALAASVVSLNWDAWRVSAGASGAIFGIAGAFVSYLYFRKTEVNQDLLKKKLKSLTIFILYNLVYGMQPGVDNSAHIGGLLAGLILGFLIPPRVFAPVPEGAAGANPMISPVEAEGLQQRHSQHLLWIGLGSALVFSVAVARLCASHLSMVAYGNAVVLAKKGQMNQAVAKMEDAAARYPGLVLPQDWLGYSKLAQGDAAGAIPLLTQVLRTYPHDAETNINLALAYLATGEPKAALEQLGEISDVTSYKFSRDFVAGTAALELGDLATAAKFLPVAAGENKSVWEAQAALAQMRAEQGNIEAARATYSWILKSDPQNEVAKTNLEILESGKAADAARNLKPADLPLSKLVATSDVWPYLP